MSNRDTTFSRRSSRSTSAEWLAGEVDPQPEDLSAIDRYTGVVDVRIAGSRNVEGQAKEARAIFDELASTQQRTALVLLTPCPGSSRRTSMAPGHSGSRPSRMPG
jgi:hypothetical protein